MKIHGIIDSIEDNIAVILLNNEEKTINIPVDYLPSNVVEGDIIDISININKGKAVQKSDKLKKMMSKVYKED
ncbi:DUF3006 domain-containing protein [Aceticella autotrophica]|uniref:DUF3006 domain-containing protein n=1 Tax=Aceticella autotrophica TaxID=2755338 RepID=A0A975GAZ9_9THEO|nr:DUF3006 domain-containing protein [Aceticella autotrophica]QSZ27908.1 DUF3006 domain-containing protein [Aceticella autotrophica]